MTTATIYTLRHAFEADPLCSVIGLEGLMRTMPQLEPGIYMIHEGHAEAGTAELHANGKWIIDMNNGTIAGPGYVVV